MGHASYCIWFNFNYATYLLCSSHSSYTQSIGLVWTYLVVDIIYNSLLAVNQSIMSAIILLLSLLCSLVEAHSQTEYPYVSFMGVNLPNHAYVDLTLVL